MSARFRLVAAERLPGLARCGRFARLAWSTSRTLTSVVAAATLVGAVAPLVVVIAIARIVGQIPAVSGAGVNSAAGHTALVWAIVVGVLFTIQRATAAVQAASAEALRDRVDFSLQRSLMSAANGPDGIAHLEDPENADLIAVGRDSFRAWLRPGRLTSHLSALTSVWIVVAGSAAIIARFHIVVAVAFVAGAVWTVREVSAASRRSMEHHHGATESARRVQYYYELGVTPTAAKEVRIFGLADVLTTWFSEAWRRSVAPVFERSSRRLPLSAGALALVACGTMAWAAFSASKNQISLESLVACAQALVVGLGAVGQAANQQISAELSLAAFRRYEEAQTAMSRPDPVLGAEAWPDDAPEQEIRFDNVRFRYSPSGANVLDGIDLVIPARRSLAIVGANGVGKTTLIKLLSRLYEPTSGRILVDGVDLSAIDPIGWRQKIGAAFQDYVAYELDARSNVGLGCVRALEDTAGIEAAAEAAGVREVIEALPRQWDTVLSAEYHDGSDLSGGEWQKVALARALFAVSHGATVLVLDEPAASLDARAEARLYEQFLELTRGVTTLVISHRFSTVRQADSIAVIRDGRIVEQGSHDELLALDGHYAEMFHLQAARFSDPAVDEGAVEA